MPDDEKPNAVRMTATEISAGSFVWSSPVARVPYMLGYDPAYIADSIMSLMAGQGLGRIDPKTLVGYVSATVVRLASQYLAYYSVRSYGSPSSEAVMSEATRLAAAIGMELAGGVPKGGTQEKLERTERRIVLED